MWEGTVREVGGDDAGVGDADVEMAELRTDLGGEVCDGGGRLGVAYYGKNLAGGVDIFDLGGESVEVGLRARGDDEGCGSGLGVGEGDVDS